MIHIEQQQKVPEHPELQVLAPTGDYSDTDLIECAMLDNPTFALCAFTAPYIAYGNIVNQFNDPLALGEALLGIDPDCTHDAAVLFKEEETRRLKREQGDFTPENPVPADEKVSKVVQEEIKEEEITPAPSEDTPTTPVEDAPKEVDPISPEVPVEEIVDPSAQDTLLQPAAEDATSVIPEVVPAPAVDTSVPVDSAEPVVRSNKRMRTLA